MTALTDIAKRPTNRLASVASKPVRLRRLASRRRNGTSGWNALTATISRKDDRSLKGLTKVARIAFNSLALLPNSIAIQRRFPHLRQQMRDNVCHPNAANAHQAEPAGWAGP